MKNAKRFVCVLATIALTCVCLKYMTDLTERKASDIKYEDFLSQEQNFDVLFMGTSHVINAVFPMELWNDYGIISYNLGGHANQVATTYWTLENALDYTTPKVVVIDCLAVGGQSKASDIFNYVHICFDAFPLSLTKIKTAYDLTNDPVMDEQRANGNSKDMSPRTPIQIIWDFSIFHSRWNELTKEDFSPQYNTEKGAESRIAVVRNTLNKIDSNQKIEGGTTGEEYLRKMIEDCQSRGMEVLLTYLPFPANENQQRTANYIYDLAEEYHVGYINFLDMDIINYQTDLYDESSHLNPSGARKVTDYLGEYLITHYDLEDHRQDSSYSFWNGDYEEYCGRKNSNLVGQNNIVNYLMLLANDDLEITFDVRNKDLFKNGWINDLLGNIGIDVSQLNENTDFIFVDQRAGECIILDNFRENGNSYDGNIGNISLMYDLDGSSHNGETGHYSVYVNGESYLSGYGEDDTSLQICVRRNGVTIDDVRFVYTVNAENTNVDVSATNRN